MMRSGVALDRWVTVHGFCDRAVDGDDGLRRRGVESMGGDTAGADRRLVARLRTAEGLRRR